MIFPINYKINSLLTRPYVLRPYSLRACGASYSDTWAVVSGLDAWTRGARGRRRRATHVAPTPPPPVVVLVPRLGQHCTSFWTYIWGRSNYSFTRAYKVLTGHRPIHPMYKIISELIFYNGNGAWSTNMLRSIFYLFSLTNMVTSRFTKLMWYLFLLVKYYQHGNKFSINMCSRE
jgi:hypothetical protein